MFVISQSPSYSWPVTVETPTSGGKYEKHTFDCEFKRPSTTRLEEINQQIASGEIQSDVALCREVLVGWKGIQDDQGQEVPFSEGARDRLLDVPVVAYSIATAFFKSINGGKSKN